MGGKLHRYTPALHRKADIPSLPSLLRENEKGLLFFGIKQACTRRGEIPDAHLDFSASIQTKGGNLRCDGGGIFADLRRRIYRRIRGFHLRKTVAVIGAGGEKDVAILFPFGERKGHGKECVFKILGGSKGENFVLIGKLPRRGGELCDIFHRIASKLGFTTRNQFWIRWKIR